MDVFHKEWKRNVPNRHSVHWSAGQGEPEECTLPSCWQKLNKLVLCCGVESLGWPGTMGKEGPALRFERGEVNVERSHSGTRVGEGRVFRVSWGNSCQLKRDSASAIELWTPGMCWAAKVKRKQAAHSSKCYTKCIRLGTLDVLALRIDTTASLSEWRRMCFWNHPNS